MARHLIPSCVIGLALVAGTVSPLPAMEKARADAMRVEVGGGLLSVELEVVPVSGVLHAIGAQAGLRVHIRGDLGDVRPQAFRGLPVGKAIQRLTADGGIGLVLLYTSDDQGTRRLTEIRAYETPRVTSPTPASRGMSLSVARLPSPSPPRPPAPPPDLPTPARR